MKFKLFKNWNIYTKIVSISVVSIILLFAVGFGVLLPFIEKQLMLDKQKELSNVTEIVVQLVNEYNERALKGEFTLLEAQNRVKERIRGLRYDNNEYFFIINTDAVIVMHPFMIGLEGKSGTDVRDPNSKALFVEMAKMAKDHGEGAVSYMWPKPGQTVSAPKQSFVRLYKPWKWIIGTGIYIDDISREINIIRYGIILTLLTCSALIMMLSLVVARRICRPLFEAIEISKRLAQGDLACSIEVNSSEETGQLMQAMQQMIAGLRNYQNSQDLLYEYQERLALIIESTDDAVISNDLEGNIFTWNKGAEKIFGYRSDEAIGKSITMLIPDSLLPDEQIVLERLKFGGEIDHFEVVRLAKGGRRINVSISISSIRDKKQNIIGLSNIIRDITEQKLAEEEKAMFYGRFKSLMDSLDSLVYVADIETHEILFINEYGVKLFGNITGCVCWQKLQCNQSGPCDFCSNDRLVLENGEPAEVYVWEFQNTITGNWYQCRDKAIRWYDNRLVRLENAIDITSRKQMEEILRENEEKYRNLFDNSEVGIYRTTLDGTITLDANQKYLDIVGKTREEVIGKPSTTNWVDPKEREELVRRLIEDGCVSGFEYKKLNHQSGVRNCLTSVVLYREKGIIEGSVLDITDRIRAEVEKDEALARVKKLEGIIPICMYCKKIRNDNQGWDQLEQYISNHSEAMFSHGICPECLEEQFAIIDKKM